MQLVCHLVGLAVRKCAVGMSVSWFVCKFLCGWIQPLVSASWYATVIDSSYT